LAYYNCGIYSDIYYDKPWELSSKVAKDISSEYQSVKGGLLKYKIFSNSITMALGEQIEESRGKITGRRVLNVKGIIKMETSFAMEGNYRGTPCTDVGTYTAMLDNGVLHGEGQGIVMTKDGQGMASWTGHGVGRFTGPGKVSFRGALYFRTPSASEGGKVSFLNNMVGPFEYEADEMGNCSSKTWEWK
jgi:hypothetical protein